VLKMTGNVPVMNSAAIKSASVFSDLTAQEPMLARIETSDSEMISDRSSSKSLRTKNKKQRFFSARRPPAQGLGGRQLLPAAAKASSVPACVKG